VLVLWWMLVPLAGQAQNPDELLDLARQFFPQADHVGPFTGEPPAAVVYAHTTRVGYVFLTDQVVSIPAYSGKPIRTLVGLDLHGRITGRPPAPRASHLVCDPAETQARGDGYAAQRSARRAGVIGSNSRTPPQYTPPSAIDRASRTGHRDTPPRPGPLSSEGD